MERFLQTFCTNIWCLNVLIREGDNDRNELKTKLGVMCAKKPELVKQNIFNGLLIISNLKGTV